MKSDDVTTSAGRARRREGKQMRRTKTTKTTKLIGLTKHRRATKATKATRARRVTRVTRVTTVTAAGAVLVSLLGSYALASAVPVRERVLGGSALENGTPPAQEIPYTAACRGRSECTVQLYARAGSVSVGGQAIPVWAFSDSSSGAITLPGPVIKVREGTRVNLRIRNLLPGGQRLNVEIPSLPLDGGGDTGHWDGNRGFVGSDTGSDVEGSPIFRGVVGTMTLQAGGANNARAPRQVLMGLATTIIVTPRIGCTTSDHCAYGTGKAEDQYDREALVALNDLDPAFAAAPLTFHMDDYNPTVHLINGKSFPDTDVIDVRAGERLLLRYANLSSKDKSMGTLGVRETVLARNASALVHPQDVVAPLMSAGETLDAAVAIPASAPAGQRYAIVDQGRMYEHAAPNGFGGQMTFIDVWAIGNAGANPLLALTNLTTKVGPAIGQAVPGAQTDGSLAQQVFVVANTDASATGGVFCIDGVGPTACPAPMAMAVLSAGVVYAPIDAVTLGNLGNGSHTVWMKATSTSGFGPWVAASTPFTLNRVAPVITSVSYAAGAVTVNAVAGTGATGAGATGPTAATGAAPATITAIDYAANDGTAAPVTWAPLPLPASSTLAPAASVHVMSAALNLRAGSTIWVRPRQGTAVGAPASVTIDSAPSLGATITARSGAYVLDGSVVPGAGASVVSAEYVVTSSSASVDWSGATSLSLADGAFMAELRPTTAAGAVVHVRARQSDGQWNETTVTTPEITAPTVTASLNGTTLTAEATATMPGATIVSIEYRKATATPAPWTSVAAASLSLDLAGDLTGDLAGLVDGDVVEVRATDSNGRQSDSVQLTVTSTPLDAAAAGTATITGP